jgi:hypothetical protein
MKKILILSVVVCLFGIALADNVMKDRLNRESRNMKRIYFGYVLDALMDIGRGAKVLAGAPTLQYGTGASDTTKIKTAAFASWNNGQFITFPTKTTAFTATSHDVASGKYATYRIGADFDDSTTVIIKSAAVYATKDSALAALPACPDSLLNLGYVSIYASGALFDATTTKLNAATVTVEYRDAINFIYDLESFSTWEGYFDTAEKP